MQLNSGSKKKETTEMARQTDQLNHKVYSLFQILYTFPFDSNACHKVKFQARARICTPTHVLPPTGAQFQREVRKDCEQGITSFFQSVFIHRYKDLHAEVRAKCTETIGKLILEYSSKFLDNGYLKYIGWALYDKSTEVRSLALDAVDNFYNNKNILGNLDAFTTRFRSFCPPAYHCPLLPLCFPVPSFQARNLIFLFPSGCAVAEAVARPPQENHLPHDRKSG